LFGRRGGGGRGGKRIRRKRRRIILNKASTERKLITINMEISFTNYYSINYNYKYIYNYKWQKQHSTRRRIFSPTNWT
jgi:hypothetical protein